MSKETIIKQNDPLTKAAKATAEERRLMKERKQALQGDGDLGNSASERRESLTKFRERIRQCRADRIGATGEMVEGG